jgi:tetrahydromethanopterin S-methyltransferase subunit G
VKGKHRYRGGGVGTPSPLPAADHTAGNKQDLTGTKITEEVNDMAADALEVRIAHLEGAYEQVDKRLGSIEGRMTSLERKVDDGFTHLRTDIHRIEQKLDGKIDTTFRWVIGIILVNWVTLMLAIFWRQ